jgi:hypothetical protein
VSALIVTVVDAFNRHGSFTARAVEHSLAVELRHVDTGAYAAVVWLPAGGEWAWHTRPTGSDTHRLLPKATTVEEVVRAVATSVLDEGPRR